MHPLALQQLTFSSLRTLRSVTSVLFFKGDGRPTSSWRARVAGRDCVGAWAYGCPVGLCTMELDHHHDAGCRRAGAARRRRVALPFPLARRILIQHCVSTRGCSPFSAGAAEVSATNLQHCDWRARSRCQRAASAGWSTTDRLSKGKHKVIRAIAAHLLARPAGHHGERGREEWRRRKRPARSTGRRAIYLRSSDAFRGSVAMSREKEREIESLFS